MPQLLNFYRLLIAIFSILFTLQIATGVWLFLTKIGWHPTDIHAFYLGDAERFMQPRSWLGLMESALPHLLAIGVTAFILSHFLMFLPEISTRQKWLWGLGLMGAACLDIAAGFLIVLVSPVFVYFKLAGFIAFEVSVFVSLFWIGRSAVRAGRRTKFSAN